MNADLDNRAKCVWVTPAVLIPLMTLGVIWPDRIVKVVEGVPADATFLRGAYDGIRNVFIFVFAHPSWPELHAGDEYPIISIVLKTAIPE